MSKKFSNDLTDAQLERLAILSEEMGEAQQVIGKIIRHGLHSWNPTIGPVSTNGDDLARELGHVRYAMGMLVLADDIDGDFAAENYHIKAETIKRWLHHQPAVNEEPEGKRLIDDSLGGTKYEES